MRIPYTLGELKTIVRRSEELGIKDEDVVNFEIDEDMLEDKQMAIDPEVFKEHEDKLGVKFPPDGTPVLVKLKSGAIIAGNVLRVWLALDTVCISVETAKGIYHIHPEFGDKFTTEVPNE